MSDDDQPIFDTGLSDPLRENTDLTNLKVLTAVPQPRNPAPKYVTRGTDGGYGYRNQIKVVTLGGPKPYF